VWLLLVSASLSVRSRYHHKIVSSNLLFLYTRAKKIDKKDLASLVQLYQHFVEFLDHWIEWFHGS